MSKKSFDFSADKQTLLEALLRKEGIETETRQNIPRRPDDKPNALSFAQQRLWFVDQLLPGSSAYNVPLAFHLRGPLDVAALEFAVNEVVKRHEILRTTFTEINDQPSQVIGPTVKIQLPIVDVSNEPAAGSRIEQLIDEEIQSPFDLNTGPLLRLKLVKRKEQDHVFVLTMHHAICDGWSLTILLRELSTFYNHRLSGNSHAPAEPEIQYADFAAWQRQHLVASELQSQLDYWKDKLGGQLPLLELPSDRPRPATASLRGNWITRNLKSTLPASLKEICDREGVTLFVLLLAAFKTLLYRYTDQEDLAIGSGVSSRTKVELESLIGHFVNTQVLRTDLSDNPSFRQLLQRVDETVRGAYAHQDLAFEYLLDELKLDRNLGNNPLFQVAFVLQEPGEQGSWRSALRLSSVSAEPMFVHSGNAKFDLTLEVERLDDGLSISFEYSKDLFDRSTIDRMIGHYQTLLQSICDNPDQSISELDLLSAEERHQLLIEWNNTAVNFAGNQCPHRRFESLVEQTPNAIAVTATLSEEADLQDRPNSINYRQLNQRANQLAHFLRENGVELGVPVGICLERSIETVVCVLGVLKAGGYYLPLDPKYPTQRLAFMLDDAQVPILLTQQKLASELPNGNFRSIYVDTDWETIARHKDNNPECLAGLKDLAYIIYTSGSTGQPKGVLIEHSSLNNLIDWHQQVYDVNASDRATLLACPAFDASVWEMWPYLAAGASIHIPPDETVANPTKLIGWLADESITISFLPTPLAELALDYAWPDEIALSRLLTGGDRLHGGLPKNLPFELFNNYGPTENTVVTTWTKVQLDDAAAAAPPIGRPVSNCQVYVLDRHLQPVPIGVPGELHIGGASLSRGYLNRAEETAKKFIVNPFSEKSDDRLYKTGDLVRYLPDGNIQFIDRIDSQVMVRGFRIELSEIESLLRQHPAIEQSVVVQVLNSANQKNLVAYVVGEIEANNTTVSELRTFLSDQLPDYMVPSVVVLLRELPVTTNGKVDRDSLPVPEDVMSQDKEYVAPQTEIERAIAAIWTDLFRIDKIGLNDNFFDLGGNSLLIAKANNRLNTTLGRDISMIDMFKFPTVSSLAEHLSGDQVATPGSDQGQQRAELRNQLRQRRQTRRNRSR